MQCLREEVERWFRFVKQTDGSDNFFKALQFGSRGVAHLMPSEGKRFSYLAKNLSDTRKQFRLLKSLQEFHLIASLTERKDSDEFDSFVRLMSIVSRSCFCGFWFFDNLGTLAKMQFIKGDAAKLNRIAGKFWVAALAASLMVEVYKLNLDKLSQDQKKQVIKACFKLLCDLIPALNGSGWMEPLGWAFPELAVAVGGTTSALIAINDMYFKPTPPKQIKN
eukprot:Filipodium_phascolosomae@DN5650_c0_g1_i1.p1